MLIINRKPGEGVLVGKDLLIVVQEYGLKGFVLDVGIGGRDMRIGYLQAGNGFQVDLPEGRVTVVANPGRGWAQMDLGIEAPPEVTIMREELIYGEERLRQIREARRRGRPGTDGPGPGEGGAGPGPVGLRDRVRRANRQGRPPAAPEAR